MAAPALGPDSARRRAVLDRLRAIAGPDGFVPFDRFMEVALYAEGVGYYDRPRSPLGTDGDFYTAAHVDRIFAECVTARLTDVRRAAGDPATFAVVELGPGDGTLAAGIVAALGDDAGRWEYVLVDRSSARLRDATARLEGSAVAVRTAGSLSELGPFAGAVLANELLDAQPARRLRWDGSAWQELGVRVGADLVTPAQDGPARPVPFPALPTGVPVDQVVEVSPEAEGIVREIADHLAHGAALILDYGLEESELVRGHPAGTLAAVRGHRSLPDPYVDPGDADLSTFVNFSRIRAVARAGGLVELSFRRQADALGAWGLAARLERALATAPDAASRVKRQLAAKNLLFGFEGFRVLELAPPGTAERLATAT